MQDVLEGRLHMRPFQFHVKEHWRFPQSLDTLLPWTETISAHLDWWQNPTNVMKGTDLHPKDHSIQLFTDASNEGWGAHLEQTSAKGLWSDREKRLHINVLELKAVSLALQIQGPVSKPNSVSCHRQLNSGSLHKQTRWNPLGGDVLSVVEDHDLVPSLPDNTKSQTHSRVSECDGQPAVQVEPSSDFNRLLSSFHSDRPKSSRNLPKWNLSVVLNELTKAPFEPMKDTRPQTSYSQNCFLASFGLRQAPQQNPCLGCKVSNLGQWEKVALFPSSDFIAKNQLAREGSQSVSPVTFPALTILDRQFKEDRTLCPVRALRYCLDRTKT